MHKLFPVAVVFSIVMPASAQSIAGTDKLSDATSGTASVEMSVEKSDKVTPRTDCIRQTGSNIKSNANSICNGQFGSAYTKEDIDRTGATTTADALQRLDTAVQIGH